MVFITTPAPFPLPFTFSGEVPVCLQPVRRSAGMAYRHIPSHFEHCLQPGSKLET